MARSIITMNCPVFYQMIFKDAFDPRVQRMDDIIAYCSYQSQGLFQCTYTAEGPEVSIYEGNIKKAYARTGPIYRLLYL